MWHNYAFPFFCFFTKGVAFQMNATLLRALKVLPLMAAMVAGGCAPKDWDSEYDGAYDPLEGLNRKTFALNKGVDAVLLKPAAHAYTLLPAAGRGAVGRVFDNLEEPVNLANNILQLEPGGAAASAARFAVNSTFGLAGLFDPATKMGIVRAEEDFGQTLRRYGWHSPPHLVLPLLGPSSLADAVGQAADFFVPTPEDYLHRDAQIGIGALQAVHIRSKFLEASEIAEESLDEYAFIRDIYEDARQSAARDEDKGDDNDDH